jgi:hypothetical protein
MLGKILKTKEKRDTALLVIMALITIAFLFYIFFPSGSPDKTESTGGSEQQPVKTGTLNIYAQLNEKLEDELNSLYMGILITNDPFENFWTDPLKKAFDGFTDDTLNKFQKLSFYDLKDIPTLPSPAEYTDSLKLNLFLSLFLIKMKEEDIVKTFETLPDIEFRKIITFDFYRLVNDEIQKDYQLMPVLFYYTVLMKRLNLYPTIDCFRFFKNKLEHIRDLTPAKYLTRMRELLRFSVSNEVYRLRWVEHDPIDADDSRVYANRTFKTFNFLRQRYLVFPDPDSTESNLWIKELCEADSGDIELSDLSIISEDPANPSQIEKIFYAPVSSQFVVLLKGYEPARDDGFLNTIVSRQIESFQKNLSCIDFSRVKYPVSNSEGESNFKSELEQFGIYLKKLSL